MCRDQVIQNTLDENQVSAHTSEIARLLQRQEMQNQIRRQNQERQQALHRLAEGPMDNEDTKRIIEVYSADNKITKGRQTKKEQLLVQSLQYGRYVPTDDCASLKFVRACQNKKKLLIKKTELKYIDKVEKYASLTIENLYAWGLSNVKNLNDYLPDDVSIYAINIRFLRKE